MIDIIIWGFIIYSAIKVVKFLAKVSTIKDMRESLRIRLDELIHNVEIETVGEVEYWYDADTKAFLGQGKTFDDVVDHLKSRFPDHIFILKDKGILNAPEWKIADHVDLELRKKHYETE
jgi:hypothetical protein